MSSGESFMRRALELAERGRYTVSPNPMVGCVIMRDGVVIAEGWHRRAGEAHAEIEALRACDDPRGATMHVTLEPCSHHGRTPPCVDAVIAAGLARVVIAMEDPHEVVNGRGIAALRAAGIEVTTGVLESEARRLNEKFVWSITQKLPFVLVKAGMTLDGKLATVARESQWITSEVAREASLRLREEFDAIVVGSGTVKSDNPRLTRRLGLAGDATPWTRVVLDGDGDLPQHSQLLSDGGRTILFTSAPARYTASPNLEIVATPSLPVSSGSSGSSEFLGAARVLTEEPRGAPRNSEERKFDLERIFGELHTRGIRSVIVEGGAVVHSEVIRRGLWQKMMLFIAPLIVGGAEAPSIFSGEGVSRLTDAYRFRFDRVEALGSDLMVIAYPI